MQPMAWDGDRSAPVVVLGDIQVTRDWVVTPNGSAPVGEVHWYAIDRAHTEEFIPTWAIVLAVVFALLCLLGLLFLLAKERRTVGYVEVTVQGPGLFHLTQLPVSSYEDIARVHGLVGTARSLGTRGPGW